jgi:hypothetical protein
MIATLVYHKQIESITNEIDAEQISVQDFSIMVQDLPRNTRRMIWITLDQAMILLISFKG